MRATSVKAWLDAELYGMNNTDRVRVFNAIKSYAPCTAKELANKSGIDYYTIQRRVSEIEAKGLIVRKQSRKCAVSKRESLVIELANSAASE